MLDEDIFWRIYVVKCFVTSGFARVTFQVVSSDISISNRNSTSMSIFRVWHQGLQSLTSGRVLC